MSARREIAVVHIFSDRTATIDSFELPAERASIIAVLEAAERLLDWLRSHDEGVTP